ncbi:sulfurtransferase [Pseudomonas sp. N040]|uniref:sulfurtransferase n=1 Tax=Pseudomonas sp. N040 TaxID=2785325 RepID=UPI0018A2C2C9|nr:sulfurtransferase [Pseudomonas sp. N040]MBF7731570.1 sulfurtransferase [Pseudomonas sp. N040]MBW7015214.1 sulfurtransferase [Pseudomonas sp. N040]
MSSPVIEVAQLVEAMARGAKLAIVDCRFDPLNPAAGEQAYRTGHIPGAHYAHLENDLAARDKSSGGRHPIPSVDEFTALMARYGVDADTLLVCYDAGDLAAAARLWWTARYFGLARVAVLNGGYAAWLAANQASVTTPAAAGNGTFSATPNPAMSVDFAAVCYGEHRPLLVDSRDPPRFSGEVEPIDMQAGHIPGAINLPWRLSLGDNGLLRSAEEMRQRWQPLLKGQAAPILYCGSGVTACVNLLALEVAGLQGARLYPGSWSDWCQHGGAVATGLSG